MDSLLFFTIFLVMGIVYFTVGYFVSKTVKNAEDYFLAGRGLNLFQVCISLAATQLGGGFILGTSQEAYFKGYYGLFYVIGICIGFILLASGVAFKLRSLNIDTTAQLFQTHYNSQFLRKVASACSIFSLTGIFAAQIIGSKALMLSLGVYNIYIFLAFWFLIILYAMMGGLKAIVQNDIFQLSFIILVFCVLFVFDLLHTGHARDIFLNSNNFIKYIPNWSELLLVPLMPALYSLIEQDLAQVFFAAKSPKVAVKASWLAAIFLILFALIPIYFGLKAKYIGLDVGLLASPLIYYFDKNYNYWIVTLITYGIFAAIISTANGVLCAISGNIVQDFNLATKSPKSQLFISRAVTIIVGIIAIF